MKKFDPNATCIKCGNDMIDATYVPRVHAHEEYLRRSCSFCGYTWNSHTLDYKEDNE